MLVLPLLRVLVRCQVRRDLIGSDYVDLVLFWGVADEHEIQKLTLVLQDARYELRVGSSAIPPVTPSTTFKLYPL